MTQGTDNMHFPIAAVERDTGLGKDTLRAWERRYGFPQPLRDANGDRQYSAAQVAHLRTVKRLLDQGHRPGKLLGMSAAQLEELAQRAFGRQAPWGRPGTGAGLAPYLEQCRLHRVAALRRSLGEAVVRLGLRDFVLDLAAPLVTAVGDCWERGEFQVFEEHLFTEVMQNTLRVAIAALPPSAQGPRIVLATFPNEQHTLGLLMAEAMFSLAGANCVSLGASTPLADIAQAGAQADVLALSFSIGSNTAHMLAGLAELAGRLPPTVELWCGGAAAALVRCQLPAVRQLGLDHAGEQVEAWRQQRRGGAAASL